MRTQFDHEVAKRTAADYQEDTLNVGPGHSRNGKKKFYTWEKIALPEIVIIVLRPSPLAPFPEERGKRVAGLCCGRFASATQPISLTPLPQELGVGVKTS